LIVIVFYVLASIAYSYVLSPARMAGATLVASDAAQVTLGAIGAGCVAVAILVSTLGANNGIILTAARIPYAMARGGVFFRSQGIVHSRFATPVVALVTQGVISVALALTGRYDQLFTYVVFAQFVFYALSAGAVILLRRRAPQLARPYRTWGYPLTPIVFIAFAVWLVGNTIAESPRESAVGAGLILLGLPGYWYWKKRLTAAAGS
jgi:APA family basic amino acid/polyamine antiporter